MTKKSHAKWICSLENATMHRYTVGVLMPGGKENSWPYIKLQGTGMNRVTHQLIYSTPPRILRIKNGTLVCTCMH